MVTLTLISFADRHIKTEFHADFKSAQRFNLVAYFLRYINFSEPCKKMTFSENILTVLTA
jgi:hypothetical protein